MHQRNPQTGRTLAVIDMRYKYYKNAVAGVRSFAQIVYPRHNFVNHILPAVRIGAELADELSAEKIIVESSIYLHDIGRIIFFYRFHERVGYYVSKTILPLLGFTKEQTNAISYCVLVHSGTGAANFETIEAEIVANADAVSQFENFPYMFSIYYCTHGKDIEKTKDWLKRKYERAWQTKLTLEVARNRVIDDYEAIEKILWK